MLKVISSTVTPIEVNIGVKQSKTPLLTLDSMVSWEHSNSEENFCKMSWNASHYTVRMPIVISESLMKICRETFEGKYITELLENKASDEKINNYLISLFLGRINTDSMLSLLKSAYEQGKLIGSVSNFHIHY